MTVVDLARRWRSARPERWLRPPERIGPARQARAAAAARQARLHWPSAPSCCPVRARSAWTLPATLRAQNWSLAWVGLDGAEAAAALATAWLLARRDQRAAADRIGRGTLLVVDAWFDVCTSAPGADQMLAVAEALLVELPLAATAIWFAVRLTRRTW